MLWRPLLRRLLLPVLVYALALQGIVAGWSGAGHLLRGGWFAAEAAIDGLCRPATARVDVADPTDAPNAPSMPASHHDCALACLHAIGCGLTLADAPSCPLRDRLVAATPPPGGTAFLHLDMAAAAFAARAPPSVI